MNEILKKEFHLHKKIKLFLFLFIVVFVGLTLFVSNTYLLNTKRLIMEQTMNSVENLSDMNKKAIERSIETRKTLLGVVANKVSEKGVYDTSSILNEIEGFQEPYGFYTMGLLDENFTLYLTDGTVHDVRDSEQAKLAWDKEFHFSESYKPSGGKGDEYVNMFSYPMSYNGQLKYVIIATYPSKELTDAMNTTTANKTESNFIVNTKGEVVIYPKNLEGKSYAPLMNFINENSDIIPNECGNSEFTFNDEVYCAYFEKLGVDDWYLMTCDKKSNIYADMNKMLRNSIVGTILLFLVVIASIILITYVIYNSRKSIITHLFYDEMLNIGNMHGLSVVYSKLEQRESEELYLVSFDVDKFKEYNYIYGEEEGDNLLKYIVRVFKELLPEIYLFRTLSDNFITLCYCANKRDFEQKFDMIMDRFSYDIENDVIQPFDIYAGVRKVDKNESLKRIMSDALIAKGTIKGIQLQHCAFYNENLKDNRMRYMAMESSFSRALKNKEFHVYYQPKYDMVTGKIIGAEALVRWIKPDGAMISLGEFIPCFESSRQIIILDQAVLEEVCRSMVDMKNAGIDIKPISVNLSRVHMRHRGIKPKIAEIINEYGVDPKMISFEITESALYEDSIPLARIVDFLHGLGCQVDMDDYGVGVSGPRALATNQFDTIKLDKSFIDGIGDSRMEAVIQSTISLSKTLGMNILAEGIEEKYQAEYLIKCGCTTAQGFYYSPPVPERAYRQMLEEDARK